MAAANRFAVLADEDAAVFASECRKYPSDRSTRGVGVFEAAHPTSLVDAADVFGADPEKPNSPSRITLPATAPSRATAEGNVPAASGRSATGTSAAGVGPAAFGATRATGTGNSTA